MHVIRLITSSNKLLYGCFILQWVYILDLVHQVLGWTGLSSVDPALTAEVVLRLALVYEASAFLETAKENKRSGKHSDCN